MPRYMVERTFTDGLLIPTNDDGARVCLGVVGNNADVGVTWVHSYVSHRQAQDLLHHDGPDPEAIRKAARLQRLARRLHQPVSVPGPVLLPLSPCITESSTPRPRGTTGTVRCHRRARSGEMGAAREDACQPLTRSWTSWSRWGQ